jgi:hypothetical protein
MLKQDRRLKKRVMKKKHIYALYLGLAVLAIVAVSYLALRQPTDKPAAPVEDGRKQLRGLTLTAKEWTGDFDKMLEYRRIRVLVPHSRTLYFNDKGRERG